jgi:hypothetical protein
MSFFGQCVLCTSALNDRHFQVNSTLQKCESSCNTRFFSDCWSLQRRRRSLSTMSQVIVYTLPTLLGRLRRFHKRGQV